MLVDGDNKFLFHDMDFLNSRPTLKGEVEKEGRAKNYGIVTKGRVLLFKREKRLWLLDEVGVNLLTECWKGKKRNKKTERVPNGKNVGKLKQPKLVDKQRVDNSSR